MSYRNPRFSLLHAAAEVNASTSLFVGTADPQTPISRLYDGRHKPPFSITTTGRGGFDLRTVRPSGVANREAINRLIIPAGHNLGDAKATTRLSSARDSTYSNLTLGGVPWDDIVILGNHQLDFEFDGNVDDADLGTQAANLSMAHAWGEDAFGASLAELYWTKTVQPMTGVAQTFGPGELQPNRVDAKTRGGLSYRFERGDPVRRFRFQHRAVDGIDKRLYDYVVNQVERGSGVVWYEHPGTGSVVEQIDAMNDGGSSWGFSGNIGANPTTARDGSANEATIFTYSSTGGTEVLAKAFSSRDWADKILRVTWRPVETAWATAGNSFEVRINSGSVENESRYELAGPVTNRVAAVQSETDWYVSYIDLQRAPESTGLYGPCDLSQMQQIRFRWAPTAAIQSVVIDDISVIDKADMPVLCEIIRYNTVQDNPAPSGPLGPSYAITMELEEVLV